ncbi:hypothetical protein GCM10010219_61920 [Streptomyces netropsis]|nr:hypothetical protein GCM10010219_61920 [Streptomyces netropsis]
MPARGQQNTDRGEHRGPEQSQIGADARDGVRHGCAIIPPPLPHTYGRGRAFRAENALRRAPVVVSYTPVHRHAASSE